MIFLRVYLICVSLDSLLYLTNPSTTIDHSAPVEKSSTTTFDLDLEHWPWPRTFDLDLKQVKRQQKVMSKHVSLLFDVDLWPTTLTYNPSLAKVKIDPHAKNQGRRSNGSSVRVLTDWRTDRRMLPNVLSPLFRGWQIFLVCIHRYWSNTVHQSCIKGYLSNGFNWQLFSFYFLDLDMKRSLRRRHLNPGLKNYRRSAIPPDCTIMEDKEITNMVSMLCLPTDFHEIGIGKLL